jgi:hypothetical protein
MITRRSKMDPYAGLTARDCTYCKRPYLVPCDGANAQCANRLHIEAQTAAATPRQRRAKPKMRGRART